ERHLVEHIKRVEAVADMIGDQIHSITNSRQNSSFPATNARRLRKGAKRRSNPSFPVLRYGLLRCARNDGISTPSIRLHILLGDNRVGRKALVDEALLLQPFDLVGDIPDVEL